MKTREQMEASLQKILAERRSVLEFLEEILDKDPPEGKTQFDLLCEKLEQVKDETT